VVTRFWWLRHGPTHEKRFLGWRDVPADLSDCAAVDRLRRHFPAQGIVISSDLARARQTADAVKEDRHRLPDNTALREFNFGAWDGLSFADIAARDPQLSREFWENPGDVAAPGGESWLDVSGRVGALVQALATRHAGADIIAVAHIGVIMTQIGLCDGQNPQTAIGHQIEPLSVTRIDVSAEGSILHSVNHRP